MLGTAAHSAYATEPGAADPYHYQTGFGNRFASEAIPGVLPRGGQNCPQRCRFDLYSEQLNGSGFISSRATLQHVWMYRIWPSVAHGPVSPAPQINRYLQSTFSPLNPAVSFVAEQRAWNPFTLPTDGATDFVSGLRTVAGQGDPTAKTGLAVHVYAADVSMGRRAFCNNDGDFLILPQQGRLDIQTELGALMVRPGELAVVQAGIKFRVSLPDGPSRGYVQEIFGTHYELPELGPIGSNGMALPHDFESPVARFSADEASWEIVYKMAGGLHACRQMHTPFDVVAWRGNLVPYKYATEKFVNVANVARDQADPTVYCVLTAKSAVPGVSLADFLVFTPKWIPTSDTFRPPYYHRNMSTEVMGLLYGTYGGSAHVLEPGGLSYEAAYMPHGETYETWVEATSAELAPVRICEDTVAFMMHISVPLLLTEWAEHGEGGRQQHPGPAEPWADAKAPFLERLDEVDAVLAAAGLPKMQLHDVHEAVQVHTDVGVVKSRVGAAAHGGKTNGTNGVKANGTNGVKTNGVKAAA